MASKLNLTVNRTDDWDSQIAFSLCGETGSIRLFRKNDEKAVVGMITNYEFYGTARKEEDTELVGSFFYPCSDVVTSLNGIIDEVHVVSPPGGTIQFEGQIG